jgi:site-specific DNA-cytosine methylase
MRVLIACEYSGKVRDAFISKGHDVMSCDILDTEKPGPHYKGDVRDILYDGWDMLIGFPPCTHLASSGARWFKEKQSDGRQQEGIDFFMLLANSGIPKIALENPVGIMSSRYRKPDQIIQPWQFGQHIRASPAQWRTSGVNRMTMIVACIVTAGLIWLAIDQLISFLEG